MISFFDYLQVAFFVMKNEQETFTVKPFHQEICNMLSSYFTGNTKNLIINIPPRFGKTLIAQYFMAYSITYLQDANFIYTSYSADLSEKAVKGVTAILKNKELARLLGYDINFTTEQAKEVRIKDGGVYGVSTGKAVTGFGAGQKREGFSGALIIDDPIKVQDIRSAVYRRRNIEYYTDTLKSRKNRGSVPFIIIAQRVHTEDLVGWIMENEPQFWDIYTYNGLENGKSTWEETKPTEELLALKKTSPFAFYSQYQQQPIIDGGEILKSEYFQTFDNREEMKYNRINIVCDTAFKTGTANDFSVLMVTGVTDDNQIHVIDMVRGKYEFPTLKSEALKLHAKYPTATFFIEDRASGTPLIQEFKANRIAFRAINPLKDKYTRLMEQIDFISNGYVSIPKVSSWRDDFIHEMTCFRSDMSHAHDDIVDTLVYAVKVARTTKKTNWGNIGK